MSQEQEPKTIPGCQLTWSREGVRCDVSVLDDSLFSLDTAMELAKRVEWMWVVFEEESYNGINTFHRNEMLCTVDLQPKGGYETWLFNWGRLLGEDEYASIKAPREGSKKEE